jgi:hypothetical protein
LFDMSCLIVLEWLYWMLKEGQWSKLIVNLTW